MSQPISTRPSTDIVERDDGYYVYINMPGCCEEDICLEKMKNELHVEGKRPAVPGAEQGARVLEFSNPQFFLHLHLPQNLQWEGRRQSMEEGVLCLFFPHDGQGGKKKSPKARLPDFSSTRKVI